MGTYIEPALRAAWQVPDFKTTFWLGRLHLHCVVIPVINEGARIVSLLARMAALNIASIADIIIVDGGSTDGRWSRQRCRHKACAACWSRPAPAS